MNLRTLVLPVFTAIVTAGMAAPAHADRIGSPTGTPRFAEPPTMPRRFRPPVDPYRAQIKKALVRMLRLRRAQQIARLRQYRMRGVFPRNTYANRTLRILVDRNGRLCAVANLVALDGQRKLVLATAKTNRFVNFKNVHNGALFDWVLTSGFTKEEIVAIQLPDRPIHHVRNPVDRERRRIIAHLLWVDRLLAKQTEASLNTMAERLLARVDLLPALVKGLTKTKHPPVATRGV